MLFEHLPEGAKFKIINVVIPDYETHIKEQSKDPNNISNATILSTGQKVIVLQNTEVVVVNK